MGGPLFLGTGKTTYANIASCKIARKSTSTSESFSEDLLRTSGATKRIPVTDVNPTRAFITLSLHWRKGRRNFCAARRTGHVKAAMDPLLTRIVCSMMINRA